MKTVFDRFMEIYGRYEQLEAEDRRDEAEELGKKIYQIFLRTDAAIKLLSVNDRVKFVSMLSESEWYYSDKIILDIASNENYSTEYDEPCNRYEKLYKKQLDKLEKRFGKKSIREYVISRAQDKFVTLPAIIRDMGIIYDMTEYTNAELKAIRDDWRGYVKKTVGQDIDIISLSNIEYRAKTMSDILNNVDVIIEYDNDLFNVEKAE